MTSQPVIKFLDLQAAHCPVSDDLILAAQRVVRSGHYIGGPEVGAFERAFADYCGVSHCKGVANGLDALRLALLAHGVGPGDEVLVPAHTFIATWLAVSAIGAIPVPVEAEDASMNMDCAAAARAVSPRTRAVLLVHLYGRPARIDAFARLCDERGLVLIEDAAQAHGATYAGLRVGGHGHTAAWSFYPGKNLGALGDGGAVSTPDAEIANKVAVLGNYGSSRKYHHDVEGVNSRLDPIQAAFLARKLTGLDEWNEQRRAVAELYLTSITNPRIRLPMADDESRSSWHLFVVRTADRDALQSHLGANGVESLIHYPVPPHLQPAYRHLGIHPDAFPIATRTCREVLSLPIGPHMTLADANRVAGVVNAFA